MWKSIWDRACVVHPPSDVRNPNKSVGMLYQRAIQGGADLHAYRNLNNGIRFQLRQKLQQSEQFYVESRGPSHDRVLLVWRKQTVLSILVNMTKLPLDIIKHLIMRKVDEMVAAENDAHNKKHIQKMHARNARYTCDMCGRNRGECQLLVSVYFHGIMCEDCLDADEELSCHKWEELF